MPVKYAELLKTVTNIIHGAWQVDFNLMVESFSLHIAGVRSLVNFSALSTWGAEVFFLSSVGAVANWQALSGLPRNIPEETFADWRVPDDTGYAQSKFISECLLDVASKESGIPSVICRIGQIAGPTGQTGVWPKQEWLPSLIRSSKHIGKLPKSLGRLDVIDWVPVNLVAQCILELAIRSRSKRRGSGALVYHVINPERSTWLELLPCAERLLGIQETVPLEAWLEALRESASQTADLTQNPGVKLLEFFNSLGTSDRSVGSVNLSTIHTMEMSKTLMELEPVRSEWLENWIRQWGF